MSDDIRPISELLAEVGELRAALDDLNVKYVRIAANGHWSYEKLGRARHGREVLERGTLLRLAELVPPGRHLRSGEWALRRYDGVAGPSILIERLPVAVADRLPQEVLATLKQQVKQAGNGVLVGEPGSGKGGLLLWLALQIPDQPVLYVAENPPSEFPGTHIMHVYPPSNAAERRSLERFVRLSPTVMWDRVARMSDLQTLYGYPGAGRRWFTTDATSVRSALRLLTAASERGCDARFSTMLLLASSVIGRPEARNLLLREDSGWSELWSADESVLELLEAYEASDIRRLGPTELSVPGIDLSIGKVAVADDFAAEAASAANPVRTEARAVDLAPVDSPLTLEVDGDELDEYTKGEAITGMLPRDEIRELREQGMVPGRSAPDAPRPPIAERTRAYLETPDELMRGEVTSPASYLTSIVPDLDDDEDEPPEMMNLDDLRITTMEDLDESDLRLLDELDELDDLDQLEGDFSEVFDAALDFESLAEEMLSDVSDVDPPVDEYLHTDPNRLVIIDDDAFRGLNVDDTSDTSQEHTVAAGADIVRLAESMSVDAVSAPTEGHESTREFTLNERLMMLRKRRNDD